MNLKDRAIILEKKLLKENHYIVTCFTEKNGIYSGVVRNNKKLNNPNAEGNLIDFLWNARLHEHLGYLKIETIKSYNAYIISDKTKLYAFNSLVSLLKVFFYEREPHNNLFPKLLDFINGLKGGFSIKKYFLLELDILSESGHHLNLDMCASNGSRENLIYVSPRSGRAVSKESGSMFANKLLELPQFLINECPIKKQDINAAYILTSYFMNRYILLDKPKPPARECFFQHILSRFC